MAKGNRRKGAQGVAETMETDNHYLYAIANDAGHVKIGHASNVKKRLSGLMTGNSTSLRVIETWPLERARAIECEAIARQCYTSHSNRYGWCYDGAR